MIKHDEVLHDDLLTAIDYLNLENKKTGLEKATNLLNAVNAFLVFCLENLVRAGKLKIYISDIPSIWRNAKKLVEDILAIFPERDIFKKLDSIGSIITGPIVEYILWCFQNIITKDNKVKIPILKIIPFIIKSISLVKKITVLFIKKPL